MSDAKPNEVWVLTLDRAVHGIPLGDVARGGAAMSGAARPAQCEEAFRRAQHSGCPVRYKAALQALREAERVVVMRLRDRR